MDAITNIIIVEDKSSCPVKYNLLSQTEESEDADLWKDGFFKSKVRRYICFTRDHTAAKWNHVLTDIVFTGLRDPTPLGYEALTETFDTKEQPLKKYNICLKYSPKNLIQSAITDIMLTKHDAYKTKQYTLVSEMNGINVCYKLSSIATQYPTRLPPPVPNEIQQQTITPLQAPPVPKPRNAPTINPYNNKVPLQKQTSILGIGGVPFKINDKYLNTVEKFQNDKLDIKINNLNVDKYNYDFSTEKNLIRQNG